MAEVVMGKAGMDGLKKAQRGAKRAGQAEALELLKEIETRGLKLVSDGKWVKVDGQCPTDLLLKMSRCSDALGVLVREREVGRQKTKRIEKTKGTDIGKPKTGRIARATAEWTPDQMLPNPAQERFCQLYSDGRYSGRSCYAQAFGAENDGTCRTEACTLLTKPDIQRRIAWLREESLKNWKCEKEEVMRFLHAVVMTPVGYVDEESPLAQEVTREEVQAGGQHGRLRRGDADEGNEVETPETTLVKTKVKMPGKKECAELLAKMQGWEKPAEVKLNVSYEPPTQALKRAADKGVDLVSILKKAGIF